MDYEGLYAPLLFLAKKKYFGIIHKKDHIKHIEGAFISTCTHTHDTVVCLECGAYANINWDMYEPIVKTINVEPPDIQIEDDKKRTLIKGLEIKRRNTCGFVKVIMNDMIHDLLDITKSYKIENILHDAFNKFYTRKWELEQIAERADYKPGKENIVAHYLKRVSGVYPAEILPKPNDKVYFVPVEEYEGSRKMDIVEMIEIVKEKGLHPNYDKCAEHLVSPLIGFIVGQLDNLKLDPKDKRKEAKRLVESYLDEFISNRNKNPKVAYSSVYNDLYNNVMDKVDLKRYPKFYSVTKDKFKEVVSRTNWDIDESDRKTIKKFIDQTDHEEFVEKKYLELTPEYKKDYTDNYGIYYSNKMDQIRTHIFNYNMIHKSFPSPYAFYMAFICKTPVRIIEEDISDDSTFSIKIFNNLLAEYDYIMNLIQDIANMKYIIKRIAEEDLDGEEDDF
jgi:hypothetical protein